MTRRWWNVGSRYREMGEMFFQLLCNDFFAKHWFYDSECAEERIRQLFITRGHSENVEGIDSVSSGSMSLTFAICGVKGIL